MNESFLAYIWKYRHLGHETRTVSGELLTIVHPGDQNSDSGPDFFNAKLRIGETTWAGNVELHVKASDWFRHGHHTDPAYDHVILHVVYDDDHPVCHRNGEPVQTLVIKHRFPPGIYDRYLQMMQNQQWIPCMNQLGPDIDPCFSLWAPALAVERFTCKTKGIRQLLNSCGHDWEEAFFLHMAGCFGFKINSLPFELLAKSLPLRIIRKHHHELSHLEAMLFGQAGMLDKSFSDPYPAGLSREYSYLRDKYNLSPVPESLWKFLRLRPSNFPTLRISQFACFLSRTGAGFFDLIDGGSIHDSVVPDDIVASGYWDNHYVFDKPVGASHEKKIGSLCGKLLKINGLAMFLFFYGLEKGQPYRCETALNYLEELGAEENVQISRWKKAGLPAENAMQTQALLHLKQFYCDRKRCLDCRIGDRLLAGDE